ncbi:hypothetical protein A2960_02805 [Candidatus Gottesmanbacteria bacterium RIFCSPLOWO2_01_FULL_39_12b]|uniref:Uncharacterized protein n=1 Tax=Candidatus Gottesmanbacteria bacterium RIFCSPLOWO2_01_FULL_39_12b TaxID=1798388 RepID=A0A1F6AQT4_9BACT|nr:MAG: hypothetical protein A2960_02805 [Candidatus Gottesmanbacteria bacterium RIFCSPLOWO2_01_FULL_39_12b]
MANIIEVAQRFFGGVAPAGYLAGRAFEDPQKIIDPYCNNPGIGQKVDAASDYYSRMVPAFSPNFTPDQLAAYREAIHEASMQALRHVNSVCEQVKNIHHTVDALAGAAILGLLLVDSMSEQDNVRESPNIAGGFWQGVSAFAAVVTPAILDNFIEAYKAGVFQTELLPIDYITYGAMIGIGFIGMRQIIDGGLRVGGKIINVLNERNEKKKLEKKERRQKIVFTANRVLSENRRVSEFTDDKGIQGPAKRLVNQARRGLIPVDPGRDEVARSQYGDVEVNLRNPPDELRLPDDDEISAVAAIAVENTPDSGGWLRKRMKLFNRAKIKVTYPIRIFRRRR